jgi:hypothetical protein
MSMRISRPTCKTVYCNALTTAHRELRALLTALAVSACETSGLASAAASPVQVRPTVVHVGLVIRNLTAIDEVKENWQLTGLLVAKWSDPSLRYRPSARGELYRDLPVTIWKPSFEFANEVTLTNFRFVDLYAQPDGTIVYAQAFNATLSTDLDLRRFPFDSQLLLLVVQARGDDLDRTILRSDRQDSTLPQQAYSSLSQWSPVSLSERLGTVAGTASHASDVEFRLDVRRNPRSYILKFILPLLLLVIISWVTFWLSHEEFKTKDQLQSAVATLLIVVAFNITVSNLLPRTDYITYIDALLFTCFGFVIVAIATIVLTHLLQLHHSEQRALLVRRIAGVALPAAFIVTQVVLFFAFHVAG